MTAPALSVVVPVYDEEDGLEELHRRLRAALREVPHEIVFVDDGSRDGSAALIEGFAEREEGIVLVQLSRNFGMEVAMSAGLDHARGDHVVLMHADLQDPPELIPEMLEVAGRGADVVYARRIGRDESWLKRTLATGFYRLMERLARTPYQGQAGDFRLLSRRVVETLRQMPERRRFLRGMVAWVGYEQVPIEYRRAGRTSGRGASYRQLARLAVEALTAFSDVPLALAAYFGMLVALLAGAAAAVILVCTVAGWLTASVGRVGAGLDAVPRRRAADQRRDPRPLHRPHARADAPAPAVPRRPRGRLAARRGAAGLRARGPAARARGRAERRGGRAPGRRAAPRARAAATPRRSRARAARRRSGAGRPPRRRRNGPGSGASSSTRRSPAVARPARASSRSACATSAGRGLRRADAEREQLVLRAAAPAARSGGGRGTTTAAAATTHDRARAPITGRGRGPCASSRARTGTAPGGGCARGSGTCRDARGSGRTAASGRGDRCACPRTCSSARPRGPGG